MKDHIYLRKRKSRKIFPAFLLIILLIGVIAYLSRNNLYELMRGLNLLPSIATTTPGGVTPKPITPTPSPKPLPKPTPSTPKTPVELSEPYISIRPSRVIQGEAALITVTGLLSTSSVKSFTFDNRPLVYFLYEGEVSALLGVDLYHRPGIFPLVVTLKNGKQINGTIEINTREVIRRPFDIPEKLGGNSPQSQQELIATLAKEGKIMNALPTVYKKLWTEKFRSPLKGNVEVEDPFGYTRVFSNSTMPHKGTDFVAEMGTQIYSMNRGNVVYVGNLRNYGNTIVIDHGFGLQTVYMHLSSTNVSVNDTVEKGEFIGLSGDTGYVLNPHLHLTVKIWDISVDPIRFLELLGE